MNPPHAHRVRPSRDPVRLTVAGEQMTVPELLVAIACGLGAVVVSWVLYVFIVGAFGP